MLVSRLFVATSKEEPKDDILKSHKLLIRAGLVKQEVSGVFNYLPLGYKVLRKIEEIVREEFLRSNYSEILCTALQAKDLWDLSGRWDKYGPELFKLKDRHDRDFCLGPTHEEVFTKLVKDLVQSKKHYPINLFQIQTKYRDERRPRFALIRSREFLMADGYSFSLTKGDLDLIYDETYKCFSRVFDRLNLNYRIVLADTGSIGGDSSHQFMALADSGESEILTCECGYAADSEKAGFYVLEEEKSSLPLTLVNTPNIKTISELSSFFQLPASSFGKIVSFFDDENKQLVFVLIRGDREVNEISVCNFLNIAEHMLRLATPLELKNANIKEGFIGPIGLKELLLVDEEVSKSSCLIVGANEVDKHYQNAVYLRDYKGHVKQFRKAAHNDLCPECKKNQLSLSRGTEVGQVFKLGTKYSKAFDLAYTDGDQKNYIEMGCYGIGISRSLQAIVEEHSDEFGIVWPLSVAPFKVVVIPTNYSDPVINKLANELYQNIKKHTECLLDDRDYQAGFKFKDFELLGIPYQIIVGKGAVNNKVEFKIRKTMTKEEISADQVLSYLDKNGVFSC